MYEMTEKMIRDAYCRIRTIDQTIPDDVLDFMKDAALEKLRKHAVISSLREHEECRLCGEPTEQSGDDELCDNCFSRNDL